MFDKNKLLYDLFQAYYDTRQHKRNTHSAVNFEMNYESKIIELRNDLVNWTYIISPSICFIIKDPVQREVMQPLSRQKCPCQRCLVIQLIWDQIPNEGLNHLWASHHMKKFQTMLQRKSLKKDLEKQRLWMLNNNYEFQMINIRKTLQRCGVFFC